MEPTLSAGELQHYAKGWLLSGEIAQHSSQTLAFRRLVLRNLSWFLQQQSLSCCGVQELRQFLAYLTNGHKEPGGRWGNPHNTRPVRPRTVRDYHGHLRTFFRWVVEEGRLDASPVERIPVPTSRADQIQPFTQDHVYALLAAAKRLTYPRRDSAILWFLLDTGVRASELCGIRRKDVDFQGKRCTILGKGNKHRTVAFGGTTAKALWNYLKDDPRDEDDPLFISERGEPLTRSGLLQLVARLGKGAKIEAVRCSPHTFRHTFAVEFLRAGGNVFTLQQLLGHTDLKMTNRYVALAQADIEAQHRKYSPADRLRAKRK